MSLNNENLSPQNLINYFYEHENEIQNHKDLMEDAPIFHTVSFDLNGNQYTYEIKGVFRPNKSLQVTSNDLKIFIDERFPEWHRSYMNHSIPPTLLILAFFAFRRDYLENFVNRNGGKTTDNILKEPTWDRDEKKFYYLRFQLYSMWIHNPCWDREIRAMFPGPSAPKGKSIPWWMK